MAKVENCPQLRERRTRHFPPLSLSARPHQSVRPSLRPRPSLLRWDRDPHLASIAHHGRPRHRRNRHAPQKREENNWRRERGELDRLTVAAKHVVNVMSPRFFKRALRKARWAIAFDTSSALHTGRPRMRPSEFWRLFESCRSVGRRTRTETATLISLSPIESSWKSASRGQRAPPTQSLLPPGRFTCANQRSPSLSLPLSPSSVLVPSRKCLNSLNWT